MTERPAASTDIFQGGNQKPAYIIVLKHENATDSSGDWREAWEELQEKYVKVTIDTVRTKTAEDVASTAMKARQETRTTAYFTEAIIKQRRWMTT